jgi:hypothetical protein
MKILAHILFLPSYAGMFLSWFWFATVNLFIVPYYLIKEGKEAWAEYKKVMKAEWARLFDL